jgi:hypothetical protein
LLRSTVSPAHMLCEPVTVPALGIGLTVIGDIAIAVPQELVTVYDIVSVPALSPVTMPPAPTVVIAVLLLLQAPPPAASVSVVFAPLHIAAAPLILPAFGLAFTLKETFVFVLPQLPVTV